jgi:hypothetical protein
MHLSPLDDAHAGRLADRHREADHARRMAAARRVGALPVRQPLRARVGLALVSLGEAVAGCNAPRRLAGAGGGGG